MTKNQDTSTHHTSPNTGPQKRISVPLPAARSETPKPRKFDVPMHVTKHPNPVGRPKTPRG
jgi:hypothetical protein